MAIRVPEHLSTVRGLTQQVVAALPPELAEAVPPGCGNNLRWQLGHVIVATEGLVFGLQREPMCVPPEWRRWFGRGTSPAAFSAATPDWTSLAEVLQTSSERILARLPELDPGRVLPEPFRPATAAVVIETVGAAIAMATWHEGYHLATMRTYARVLAGQGA
jgi:hypothetical protein